MNSAISDEESYQNAFYYFIEAVKVLSEPAERQCELMGNYNVPWELKDDVSAGLYLINNPASKLTEGQRLAIQQLISELNQIPDSVINAKNTPENNLVAMQKPVWEPLRKQAAELLCTLETATKSNEKYFKHSG